MNSLEGRRFHQVLVVAFLYRRGSQTYWQCLCDCGNYFRGHRRYLINGSTKSCPPCQKMRAAQAMRKALLKHGHTVGNHFTSEYRTWLHIRSRCYDPRDKNYKDYGGRGITVCEQWRDDFAKFLADMGPRPFKLELDRRDNNLGYSPENCRWASRSQQCRNRRDNVWVTIKGERKLLAEWSDLSGIKLRTLHARLHHYHWHPDQLLIPVTVTKNIDTRDRLNSPARCPS